MPRTQSERGRWELRVQPDVTAYELGRIIEGMFEMNQLSLTSAQLDELPDEVRKHFLFTPRKEPTNGKESKAQAEEMPVVPARDELVQKAWGKTGRRKAP